MAESVGVLAVHAFIDRHRELRIATARSRSGYLPTVTRIPNYYRSRPGSRSRSSSRSTDPANSQDGSPAGLKAFNELPYSEMSMYNMKPPPMYDSELEQDFLAHNCVQNDKDANRWTTPV
ncbi:hypothetical protein DNTS_002064 [Danionella cerebrum]|uniref:Uncharacterized protein n=1 Tax=Danionella cerebrum TaxID=2873325 RepID=A0A553MZ26_9TELE|nr:hypothetical protein DNTS_002064 [Danionella translucida]